MALRSDVVAHIAENATDPELNADRIAAHLGISLRTLLRVFEKTSMTVACHIAAARLARALETLRSRDHAHLADHEVARRAGYGCPSVMGRAVLLATGMTPGEHRDGLLA